MCGICGLISQEPGSTHSRETMVREMMHLLRHRGPDDEGIWSDPFAVLGHLRLSVIDLSKDGHEPMISEDGRKALVFNGEIYNFLELKRRFAGDITFRFQNDIEVILKLYEKFGAGCLQYFRGMFAFAIWDQDQKQLFFARDRLGKKPFYYSLQNDEFLFASELRALLIHPRFKFEIDDESIAHYLTLQYVPAPRTIFKQVWKLPPAHFGIFNNGHLKIERYWHLKYEPKDWSENEALERLDDVLRESVRLRMIADVPLGAFLSGGMDSSTIVALMSQLSTQPVKTFTIRFGEEEYNEAPFAREVAEKFGTEHQELAVTSDHIDVLSKLVWHFSEPFADSSAIPFYFLSEMTRNHVTVALSGDGGDELFAGYGRYLFQHNGRWSFPALCRAAELIPMNLRYFWRIRKFIDEHFLDLPSAYMQKICYFDDREKQEILTSDFLNEAQQPATLDLLRKWFSEFPDVPFPQNLLAVDIRSYLPDDLLVKADIASMASSLEVRSPFLDHKVMEFAASLPFDLKMKDGISKYLLKRYMERRMPVSVLNRSKMGFGVPIKVWFRNELKEFLRETLLSSTALQRGYFKPAAIEKMIQRHVSGVYDYSYKLYALLMLELWHRTYVDHSVLQQQTALNDLTREPAPSR